MSNITNGVYFNQTFNKQKIKYGYMYNDSYYLNKSDYTISIFIYTYTRYKYTHI